MYVSDIAAAAPLHRDMAEHLYMAPMATFAATTLSHQEYTDKFTATVSSSTSKRLCCSSHVLR